jgi:hypothetical protein
MWQFDSGSGNVAIGQWQCGNSTVFDTRFHITTYVSVFKNTCKKYIKHLKKWQWQHGSGNMAVAVATWQWQWQHGSGSLARTRSVSCST